MGYIIGSLNTRHFSGVGTHNENKMAEIILSEQFDIVALQEVKRKEAIDYLLQRLPGWAGDYGKSQSDSDYGNNIDSEGGGLGFAFLWNTRRVTECSKDGHPEIITYKSSAMARKPYYGRFSPSGLIGGSFFEIRLINIHLWHGQSYSEGTLKRLGEFQLVTDDIYSYISNRRYGDFRPAYTVILGDYNFSAVYCQRAVGDADARYFVNTKQEEKTTISKENSKYASNYDHFSYNEKRFESSDLIVERVESVGKYMDNDFEKHWQEVSDHVPIKLEIILNAR